MLSPATEAVETKVSLNRAISTSPPRQSSSANAGKTGGPSSEEQAAIAAPAAHSAPTRCARPTNRSPNLVQRHADITGDDDSAGPKKR